MSPQINMYFWGIMVNSGINIPEDITNLLIELGEKHVGLKRIKFFFTPKQACFLMTKIYDKYIVNSSKNNAITKEIIQSIIYRELIFLGIEDYLADIAVMIGLKEDSSTGPAQIFAKTAINAYNSYFSKKIELNKENIKKIWCKLQDDEYNILFAGLELKRIIEKEYCYNEMKMKKNNYIRLFARYNGTGIDARKYGRETYKYFVVLRKIDKT